MVSKNNLEYKKRQSAQQLPHYGLRRLSVGVASVLLGTSLYLGVNNSVANADTVTPWKTDKPVATNASTAVANQQSSVVPLKTARHSQPTAP